MKRRVLPSFDWSPTWHLLDDAVGAVLRLQVGLTPRENTRADDQRFRGARRALCVTSARVEDPTVGKTACTTAFIRRITPLYNKNNPYN